MGYPSLQKISSQNYKNLENTDIGLNNLNILIGSNGSGKSNFIALLVFLKECLSQKADENRTTSMFEDAIRNLGGSKALNKKASFPERISLSYGFKIPGIEKGLNLSLSLYIQGDTSKVTIYQESISDSHIRNSQPFFYYKFHDRTPGKGVVSVWNDSNENSSHFENVNEISTSSLGLTIIHDLLENSENSPQRTPIYKVRRQLLKYINNWHFYNSNSMNLEEIRTSEPKIGQDDIYLSHTGTNLAIVIENLVQQNLDFEEKLNSAMKSILQQTKKIRPVRTGLMTVNIEWYFQKHHQAFYLNELSDGTIRMLCWATILLSPQLPSLLVIDEPELGIHPAWMPILSQWIKYASQSTQVIISTHSPDLLDQFTDEIENVYCFSQENNNHYTINKLNQSLLKKHLEEGWQLGDLYRIGEPDLGGWPW